MKLLVALTPGTFRDSLCGILKERHEVDICDNTVELMMALMQCRPELLILDLMLPGTGGLLTLQTLQDADCLPPTLVVAPYISRYIADQLDRLGVLEVFRIPCSPYAVAGRVMRLEQEFTQQMSMQDDLYRHAERILFSLGLRRDLVGYSITLEAILSLCRNPDQMLTKELYPAIAGTHGGTAAQTEKAIRTCIKSALRRNDKSVWMQYFGRDDQGGLPKITNAVFLYAIAQRLRSQNCAS